MTPDSLNEIKIGDQIKVSGRKKFWPVHHVNPVRYEMPNNDDGVDSHAVWTIKDVIAIKRSKKNATNTSRGL